MTLSPLHAYVFATVLLTASGLALWSAWRRRPKAAFERLTAGLAVTGMLAAGGLGWLAYSWQHGVTFGEERRAVLHRPAPELVFRLVDDDRDGIIRDTWPDAETFEAFERAVLRYL